ncbi:hyaluronan-binding protein 2 [Synchiropus picturatus]
MNLKLLLLCLFLVALILPAELKKKKKHKHHHRHHHGDQLRHHHKKPKKHEKFIDIITDYFFNIDGRTDDEDDDDRSEWLFDIQEPEGLCNPNPCKHNGECREKGGRKFKCDCPKPFKGKMCERGPKVCRKGRCGRGECVLTSTAPFYECRCKVPFLPPDCKTYTVCQPNPCQNGGQCIRDGNDFDCECPAGFRGRFCQVGPDDCYEDDGESYRGKVSETEDGDTCLYWNSHFILESGTDPFNNFEDKDGLGPHNFCRNPDGDSSPWCFYRRGKRLLWDHCDVTECPEPTDESPTEGVLPAPEPTDEVIKPIPPKPTAEVLEPTPENPTEAIPTDARPQQPEPSAPIPPQPTIAATLKPNSTLPFSTCGQPQRKKVFARIFGGLKVPPGSIPWQVSLQARPRGSQLPYLHTCGGVLIESCWVLTAGHCIEQNKEMQVEIGGLALNAEEPDEQTLKVVEAIRHENYRETPTAVHNDIALLRLEGSDGVCANETQYVKAACLPTGDLPDGMECTISGWGATEDSQYGSNHLLEAEVLLINQEKCSDKKVYGSILDNSMFCAGYLQGGVDSCQGDSGGPLTCNDNNSHIVYGLVSWGDQCGKKNKPGVYTRVTHFLDWIKSKTQASKQ